MACRFESLSQSPVLAWHGLKGCARFEYSTSLWLLYEKVIRWSS